MRIGSTSLVLTFLGGLWLIAAPALVGFPHPPGNPWTTAFLITVILGVLTSLVSLVGLLAFVHASFGELERQRSRLSEATAKLGERAGGEPQVR